MYRSPDQVEAFLEARNISSADVSSSTSLAAQPRNACPLKLPIEAARSSRDASALFHGKRLTPVRHYPSAGPGVHLREFFHSAAFRSHISPGKGRVQNAVGIVFCVKFFRKAASLSMLSGGALLGVAVGLLLLCLYCLHHRWLW